MNPLPRSNEPKSLILQNAIAKLEKTYGTGVIFSMDEDKITPIDVISTGAVTLDQALGIGGFPCGRITELFGVESSGKTTLALTAIANCQRAGGTAAIVDVEHAIDLQYAANLGVDIANLLISQPDSGEQALDVVETLVRAGVDIVVLDSVAMLIPAAEIAGEMNEFQVGAQSRLVSKALRKLTAPVAENGTALIMINQLRSQIGYGAPETTPGGKALKYAASVRIDLRKGESIRDDGESSGIKVKAKVVKNKLAKPFGQCEFTLLFNKGISYEASLVEAALLAGVVKRGGAWLSLGEMKFQGSSKLVEWLEENPEEATKLKELL